MRHFCALTVLAVLVPGLALAQVTVNPAALQQLAGVAPPPPSPPLDIVFAAPAKPPAPSPQPKARPAVAVMAPKPAKPAAPVEQATAHVPAPAAPAAKPAPQPPAPPAAPQIPGPVSLTFASGSAVVPANAATVLKPFCAAQGKISIDARAPADPADPSAAMRLSLSRALAVQAVLRGCGVPAQNILPRALGNVPGQNEDVITVGSGSK